MREFFPYIFFFILFTGSCEKDDDPQDQRDNCPPFSIVPASPFSNPIWHPNNKIIGFNHKPIKKINYQNGIDCPNQAVYEYEEDSTGFWLIKKDGTNKRKALPYKLTNPAWSPDGKKIVFSRNGQICTMPFDGVNFDTTAIKKLTSKGRNFFPSWSPDGKWITYDSNRDSPTGLHFIWKMKNNGGEKKRIAYTPDQGETRMPYWGKDSLIVHQRFIGQGSSEIFLMNSNGENQSRITNNDKNESLPKLSPNNELIGYISPSPTGQFELFTLDRNTLNIEQLTSDGCQDFSWSPEGRIVYVNYNQSRITKEKGALWIMDQDGSGKRQLTFNDFQITQ